MKRREFIGLLGGAAASSASWPLAARAQGQRLKRIAVHMNSPAESTEAKTRIAAFVNALQQLGWVDGRNMKLDLRLASGADIEKNRRNAAELVALAPDVILATTTPSVTAVQQVSGKIPVVFAMVVDPVGSGVVDSLSRPGGYATGFMQFEYSLSGKWLELLKQIVPNITRAAVFRDPSNPSGVGQFAVIQTVASSLGIEVIPINVRDAADTERRITAFAGAGDGGFVSTGGQAVTLRDLIVKLAVRHRFPAVYPYRYWVDDGGLISYGPDLPGLFRQSAGYVDRILRGEKPADLPVQAPTKYELVINLKAAKAIGLDIPASVLVRADEVIE